jgi:hypothetical protein
MGSSPMTYTASDILRMAADIGHPQSRQNFNAALLPKLQRLEIGTRYGNNRTPHFYTREMARDILIWIAYRGYLQDNGRVRAKAPFSADDILGVLALADNLRIAGNRENVAMNYAMDCAESILTDKETHEQA